MAIKIMVIEAVAVVMVHKGHRDCLDFKVPKVFKVLRD
jgi:hypothetical protein